MALWCNWLTQMPITHKSWGSNPRRVERSGCMPTAIAKEYKE